jgi:Tyrosine phosphatase family
MNQSYPRHIHFESVPNFRDLGGYRTRHGRAVAWRRLFRSAELHSMSRPDIAIHDYTLSAPFMPELRDRWRNDPAAPPEVKEVPDSHWEASAESMARFLALLRREYGSAAGYLTAHGADHSLPQRLGEALLV